MRRTCNPLILLAVLAALVAGCSDDATKPGTGTDVAGFKGSQSCSPCHREINEIWSDSGHPTAMIRVDGNAPVSDFSPLAAFASDPVDPPSPFPWEDISYVAGGYGWKMLWISKFGYAITSFVPGFRVQYNFSDRTWSFYGSYAYLNQPANCGRCHATGWVEDVDWQSDEDLGDNQDGLEGMPGTFFAPGIHCEECHGPGNLHVANPERHDLLVDRSSADCGRCHFKDPQHTVLAGSRFIMPNSQYDEWLHSGHAILGTIECVDCHDPHASVKYDATARGSGTFSTCEQCHADAAAFNAHDAFAPTACVDCHMPFAVQNATSVHDYRADMRTHLMDITTEPIGRSDGMGMAAGGAEVAQDAGGMSRITLDLACYGCHQDSEGNGGDDPPLSLEQLSTHAIGIHEPIAASGGSH